MRPRTEECSIEAELQERAAREVRQLDPELLLLVDPPGILASGGRRTRVRDGNNEIRTDIDESDTGERRQVADMEEDLVGRMSTRLEDHHRERRTTLTGPVDRLQRVPELLRRRVVITDDLVATLEGRTRDEEGEESLGQFITPSCSMGGGDVEGEHGAVSDEDGESLERDGEVDGGSTLEDAGGAEPVDPAVS